MKKTKKGFTIVELVIVIAVIAVLTAILVPTFIHLNNKANEAADKSLVTNLNKALAMREAEEGDKGKNMTMYDCVEDLRQEGYSLPQLATRSGQDLVWSQHANRFFLSADYNEVDHGKKYNCWHVYEKMPSEQTWAIYPNEDKWTEASVPNLKVGFDAGKADISTIDYKGDAGYKVVIRTNSANATLRIDAKSDTVSHYGVGKVLDIKAIGGNSYHEFGHFQKAEIKQGRIVVEDKGEVEILNVTGSGVVLDTAGSGTVDLCYANSSENVPTGNSEVNVVVSNIDLNNIVARTDSGAYATLTDAVSEINGSTNGGRIVVLEDIDFSTDAYAQYKWAGSNYNPLVILANNVTLDLCGHEFFNMGNCALVAGHLYAADGRISNFTLENGTLRAGKTDGVVNSYVLGIAGVDGATIRNLTSLGGINVFTGSDDVIIENCTLQGSKYYTVCTQTGSHVTIRGKSFGKNTDASVANPSMFWIQGAGSDSDCATPENPQGTFGPSSITIESGSYTVAVGGAFYLAGASNLKPVVKGGSFNFDPTEFIAPGHTVVSNDSGIWTVQ